MDNKDEIDTPWDAIDWKNTTCDAIQNLIDKGFNVNVRNKHGETPIFGALFFKTNADVMRILLNAGADVNIQDRNGWTPLHWAVVWSGLDFLKLLLEYGANANIQNNEGKTPIDIARQHVRDNTSDNAIMIMKMQFNE